MSNFNTQSTESQSVTNYGAGLQLLVDLAEAKGFDYHIEEVPFFAEGVNIGKTIFSFRQDRGKNSMIYYSFFGFGNKTQARSMYFNMRRNGANGYEMRTFNQEYKAKELLGYYEAI